MSAEVPAEAIDAAVRAVEPIIPNSNGVMWEFTHEDGQTEPVTLRYAMQSAIAAALPLLIPQTEEQS